MDIEHSLYRIYERILSYDGYKLLIRYCCVYLSLILGFFVCYLVYLFKNSFIGLITFAIFLYANIAFKDQSVCLEASYKRLQENLSFY